MPSRAPGPPTTSTSPPGGTSHAKRVFRVQKAFASLEGDVHGPGILAQATEPDDSAVHRVLQPNAYQGLFERVGHGRYRLGMDTALLGIHALSHSPPTPPTSPWKNYASGPADWPCSTPWPPAAAPNASASTWPSANPIWSTGNDAPRGALRHPLTTHRRERTHHPGLPTGAHPATRPRRARALGGRARSHQGQRPTPPLPPGHPRQRLRHRIPGVHGRLELPCRSRHARGLDPGAVLLLKPTDAMPTVHPFVIDATGRAGAQLTRLSDVFQP